MKYPIAALALGVFAVSSCRQEEPPPPRPDATRSYEEPASETPPAEPSATVVAKSGAQGCEAADLSFDPSTVVAKVGQNEIKWSDVDPAAADAEDQALRRYCSEISRIRQAATDAAVENALLEDAAKAEGVDVETYVRTRLDKDVADPTDLEIEAYYSQFKKDDAPPLEDVKSQVIAAMRRDASEKVYQELVEEVRSKGQVEMKLPDMRPPAQDVDVPEHSPSFGPAGAKVQVVEFSDFECPYCAKAAVIVNRVKAKYGDRVQFAYRHFPLSFHPNAKTAAEYAQCAHEQGKFWEMHDAIFENQREIAGEGIKERASQAGLDMGELQTCLASGRASKAVDEDMQKGREVGVEGTPTFYVNGRTLEAGLSEQALSDAIDAELARAGS
jgi:protein-disulfide isomerase